MKTNRNRRSASRPSRFPRPYLSVLLLSLLAAVLPVPMAQASTGASPTDAAELLREIREAELDIEDARAVGGLRLDTGFARLRLQDGLLVPVRQASGEIAEMIFVGDGRVEVEAPDEIEAGQLDLFTGGGTIDEAFDEAVLVVGSDRGREALLGRPRAETPDAATLTRARSRFESWRASRERELLSADIGMAIDQLGDPLYDSFFVAWFQCKELGEIILAVDPEEHEQITLGRFEPLEATAKEERKLKKAIGKAQRRGRLLGLEVDDLGVWDTWMSVPIHDAEGQPSPGTAAFRALDYRLEVEANPKELALRGKAEIELEPNYDGARAVRLALHRDLEIDRITDAEGRQLHSVREGTALRVFLPTSVGPGSTISLHIDYHGRLFQEGNAKVWTLLDNYYWHPRTADLEIATYDLTLRWPHKLDLLAAGDLVAEGRDGDYRWQRRRLSEPGAGLAFTLGRYRIETARAGDTEIIVGVDRDLNGLDGRAMDEILDTARTSLEYFESIFGPYPYDHLVIATGPSDVSQAMPGFVVLSNLMMLGRGGLALVLGLDDRRTVVAHEIAHQWWGHAIRWDGYRDQWISEAMANYAAMLWVRNVDHEEPIYNVLGPTSGWRSMLAASLENGRTIESLGPLVLGERLSSSLSSSAYTSIVYRKGAVVLDMLSRHWAEADFVEILGSISNAATGHSLSTAELFDLVEQASGKNLDAFADRFVYGTGLIDVYYDYRIEATDAGWAVHLTMEQQAPYRFAYAIEQKDGYLDVGRTPIHQIADESVTLVVPVQLPLVEKGKKKRKKDAPTTVMNGRLLLDQQKMEITLPLQQEPESLELDGNNEVFGRFWNRQEQPKRVGYYQAFDLVTTGRAADARRAYLDVLATTTPSEPDAKRSERKDQEQADQRIDGLVHLQIARIELEEGNLGAAEARLGQALEAVHRKDRWRIDPLVDLLEARIALRRGDAETAFRTLRKLVLKKERLDRTEAWLLLAIAAKATGNQEELEKALEAVEGRDTDLGPLAEL